MPDQLRYDSLGFTGNPAVKTPNLDSFARSGTTFTSESETHLQGIDGQTALLRLRCVLRVDARCESSGGEGLTS